MKRIKKTVAFVLAFTLILGIVSVNTYAASFLDTNGHWAQNAIEKMADKGIISGMGDGTFAPNAPITRAQFFTMLNFAFGFVEEANVSFSDVKDEWFAPQIRKAVAAGYLTGYDDNTVKPNANITRSEVTVVITKIMGLTQLPGASDKFTDASSIPSWAKPYVDAIAAANLMGGYPDGSFGPARNETRAEATVLIAKSLEFNAFRPGNQITTSVDGDLTVSSSYGPEAGNTVINGNVLVTANGITLKNVTIKGDLTIDPTAGNGTIYLTNIKVEGTIYVKGGKAIRMSGNAENVEYSVKDGAFALTSGLIKKFTVTKEAEGAYIDLAKDAGIEYAVVNARCTFTGRGYILKALINVTGVKVAAGMIRSYESGSKSVQVATSGGSTSGAYWDGGVWIPPYVPGGGGETTVSVTSISIKTEPKVDYNENDSLDLAGLVVTLNLSNSTTKDVAFAQFGTEGLTTNPVNGATLNTSNTKVEVTHNASGNKASFNITVNPSSSELTKPPYVKDIKVGDYFGYMGYVEVFVDENVLEIVESVTVLGEDINKMSENVDGNSFIYIYDGDVTQLSLKTIYDSINVNFINEFISREGDSESFILYNSSFGTNAFIYLTQGLNTGSATVIVDGETTVYDDVEGAFIKTLTNDYPAGTKINVIVTYKGVSKTHVVIVKA